VYACVRWRERDTVSVRVTKAVTVSARGREGKETKGVKRELE
jgi:hypothetical protein